MTGISSCFSDENNYSYQHQQGVMLVNLNKLSLLEKFSHAEYRLMAILIGFWNKNLAKAYPSIRILAKYCCMSHTTILKCLKTLSEKQLILIIRENNTLRNNYYLNLEVLLKSNVSLQENAPVTKPVTACKKTINNIIELKTKKNIIKKITWVTQNQLMKLDNNNQSYYNQLRLIVFKQCQLKNNQFKKLINFKQHIKTFVNEKLQN